MRLSGHSGLQVELNANGSLRRFACGAVSLSLFVGNEVEGGPANLYLRCHADRIEWTPLLGPFSPTRFHVDAATGRPVGHGSWLGINYSITPVLAQSAPAWFWHVRLENTGAEAKHVDLTYAQDLALASYGAVRLNEFYVSQYIDHTPLSHAARGVMIASRQNQAVDGRNPWSLIGSLRKGASFATDALQFHGLAARAGQPPVGISGELPNRRLQHEHAMVVIRDAPIRLEPKGRIDGGFFGCYLADHPEATSTADVEQASAVFALPEATAPKVESSAPAGSEHSHALQLGAATRNTGSRCRLPARDIRIGMATRGAGRARCAALFLPRHRSPRRAPRERAARDCVRTVTCSAPAAISRPMKPALTSTAWMGGIFHSMLTQGHVSINRLLSTAHSYLSLFRSHGQRVFVQVNGAWRLLDTPSAFEMSPEGCRWLYRHAAGEISVRAEAQSDPQELSLTIEVTAGPPVRCLISHHIALNGDDGSVPGAARWQRDGDDIVVAPAPDTDIGRRFPNGSFRIAPPTGTTFERVGGDELLFVDGRSREQPYHMCGHRPGARGRTRAFADT